MATHIFDLNKTERPGKAALEADPSGSLLEAEAILLELAAAFPF